MRATRTALAVAAAGLVACTETPPAPAGALVISEVAAAGVPADWIEVVNVSAEPLELVDYVFVDERDNLDKARPFADVVLAPGDRHVQTIDDASCGFRLAGDEEVWIYRASDGRLIDGVDWHQGASPPGGSVARSRDTGDFVTVTRPTRGAANGVLP
jgi:hypothetical protein